MGFRTKSLLLVLLLAGCPSPDESSVSDGAGTPADVRPPASGAARNAVPRTPPEIRGIVTAADAGSVRVEANPAEAAGSPKAVVRLTSETLVVYRNGDPAEAEELTVGHNVSVWFTGPVMESYPVQATAAAVVIEPIGTSAPPPGAL